MRLVQTKQERVAGVAEHWNKQYANDHRTAFLRTAKTPQEVAAIIGNDSWTRVEDCDDCGMDESAVVMVGQEPDYDSATAYLCKLCVEKLVQLMKERP